jgi:hypothetical protein
VEGHTKNGAGMTPFGLRVSEFVNQMGWNVHHFSL